MAHYSPEMLAALRHDYENTDETLVRLAAKYKIGITTLERLVDKHGWAKRSQRVRDWPRETQLLEAAKALGTATNDENVRTSGLVPPLVSDDGPSPTSWPGLSRPSTSFPHPSPPPQAGEGKRGGVDAHDKRGHDGSEFVAAGIDSSLSPVERLEALVVKEIAAEEAVRERLQSAPRRRAESERCARTLSILAQTLRSLQQQRSGRPTDDETPHDNDDLPVDIDEFRRELARRIDAFVTSRADAADAGESTGSANVDEV